MGNHKRGQGPVWRLSQPAVTYETVIPNPKLKLLDQVREVMRLKHYSTRLLLIGICFSRARRLLTLRGYGRIGFRS